MANVSKKGVTSEQLREICKQLNLTVSAVAEGTGLSKAYISEFRNETRNLSVSQQAQLRSYLEEQCEAAGIDFPDDASDAAGQQLVQGLGGMIQRINRPAILLSDDIPKAQADQLVALIDANRVKVVELLGQEFEPDGLLGLGGEFSPATDDTIRQVFALLALNYLAILYLQGQARIFVKPIPEGQDPKTIGEWFSRSLIDSPLAGPVPELLPANAKEPVTADGEGA